ncbi:hypothetical protein [Aminobacter carboxidus]|uniref:Uncharacterized protein n=1 Tax=Aminobacter carboxidus TaxID=376165 RepID=A0ABR9GXJ9_9HYPH|nr:hypothetical protein [Aminobacter carboxidus]MBE1208404.1 hypothetical protein [Aminobacter carboxidus]
MESTFLLPTVFANRFIVGGYGEQVRISFGESRTIESPINFRGSVALTPYQAWELAKVLLQHLGPHAAQFEAELNAKSDAK